MSLFQFCLACMGGFALLQFVWIPWIWRQVRVEPTKASIPRLALWATLCYARNVLIVSALTSAAVLGFVTRLPFQVGASLPEIRAALGILQHWHDEIAWIRPGWSAFGIAVLTIAMGVHVYRRSKARVEQAFQRIFEREMARLKSRMESGQWENLPPNAAMTAVLLRIAELERQYETLNQGRYNATIIGQRAKVEQELEQLRARYTELDLERRANIRLDREAVELPAPRNLWEWLQAIVMSRGMLWSLSRSSRLLHAVHLALIVAGLIGFHTLTVNVQIEERMVKLLDLEIHLQRLDGMEVLLAQIEEQSQPNSSTSTSTPNTNTNANASRQEVNVRLDEVETRFHAREGQPPQEVKKLAAQVQELRDQEEQVAQHLSQRADRMKQAQARSEEFRARTDPEAHRPRAEAEVRREQARRQRQDLDAEGAEPEDPTRALRDRIGAIKPQLADAVRMEDLAADRADLERIGHVLETLKAERLARVQAVRSQLDQGKNFSVQPQRVASIAARIERLEADPLGPIAQPIERAERLRRQCDAEETGRTGELKSRREELDALETGQTRLAKEDADLRTRAETLRVELNRQTVRLDWELARSGDSGTPRELSAEDRAILRRVAEEFEARLAADTLIADAVREPESSFDIRSMAVRDRLLREASVRSPTPRDLYAAMDRVAGLDPKEKEVAEVFVRSTRPEGFRTKVGARYYQKLLDAAQHSTTFLQKIKTKYLEKIKTKVRGVVAAAGRPARSAAWQREMGTHIFNLVLGDVPSELGSAVGQVLDDTMRQRQEAQLYRCLNDMDGATLDQALARVAAEEPGKPFLKASDLTEIKDHIHRIAAKMPSDESLAAKLREHLPAAEAVEEPGVQVVAALKTIDDYVRRQAPAERRRDLVPLADFAATYTDRFPPQSFAELQSLHGQIVEHWEWRSDQSFQPGPSPRVDFPSSGPSKPFPASDPGEGTAMGAATPMPPRPPGRPGGGMIQTPREPDFTAHTDPKFLASQKLSRQARNFGMLQGYARVGGVLIGRAPEPAPAAIVPLQPVIPQNSALEVSPLLAPRAGLLPLPTAPRYPILQIARETLRGTGSAAWDIREIRWEVDGRLVRLILIDGEGKSFRSRPFRRSLVEHALAYAADGRPTTATMVTSQPLADLRILVHPTLVDTPLGHRVIELDRFVDRFTSHQDWRSNLEKAVRAQGALYRLAWAQRLLVLDERGLLPSEAKVHRTDIQAIMDRAKQDDAELALKDQAAMKDPARSPLTVKKEYFDQYLVDWIIAAADQNPTLGAFTWAIQRRARSELDLIPADWHKRHPNWIKEHNEKVEKFNERIKNVSVSYSEKEAMKKELDDLRKTGELYESLLARWLVAGAAHFEVWSGVREKPYTVQPAEVFVADGAPIPMPFEFILQIAFTSPAMFAYGDPPVDQQGYDRVAAYADEKPWKFLGIAPKIQQAVLFSVGFGKDADKEILADVGEFTMLQRLFRLGFEGGLGKEFPVEALTELQRAVAEGETQTAYRTLRWHSQPGLLEKALNPVFDALDKVINAAEPDSKGAWFADLAASVAACRKLLKDHGLGRVGRGIQFQVIATASKDRRARWDTAWSEAQSKQEAFEKQWEETFATFLRRLERVKADAGGGDNAKRFRDKIITLAGEADRYSSALKIRRSLEIVRDDKQSLEEQVGLLTAPKS